MNKTRLFAIFLLPVIVTAANLQGIQITLTPNTVNARNATLAIYGTIATQLNAQDYIVINLPAQVSVANSNSQPTNLSCTFTEPSSAQISSCQSLSALQVRLTLKSSGLSGAFQINIQNSISGPASSSFTSSFQFITYRSSGVELDQQTTGLILQVNTASLSSVIVASTLSQTVGQKTNLVFTLTTANPIPVNGTIQITFPVYFQTGQIMLSYVISSNCLDSSNQTTECDFDPSKQTLTFPSLFLSTGALAGQTIRVTVIGVQNPIVTWSPISIQVQTTDANLGAIDVGSTQYQAQFVGVITSPQLNSSVSTVQELSDYTISFVVPVPMYQGCQISIFLPYSPDYDLSVENIVAVQGFQLLGSNLDYTVDVSQNAIVISNACQTDSLANAEAVVTIIGIHNPSTVMTTKGWSVSIVDSSNNGIANLLSSAGPTFTATPGIVESAELTSDTQVVGSVTNFAISFSTQHTINQFTKIIIGLNDPYFSFTTAIQLTSSDMPNLSSNNNYLTQSSSSQLTFSGFVTDIQPNQTYTLSLSSLQLALFVATIGDLSIAIYQTQDPTQYPYSLVDEATFSGLISTEGGTFLSVDIIPSSLIASDITTYTFNLIPQNPVPQGAVLTIFFPQEVLVPDQSKIACKNSLVNTQCAFNSSSSSIAFTSVSSSSLLSAETNFSLLISGIENPRSLKTSSQFAFLLQSQGGALVDQANETNFVVTMTQPSIIEASVESVSSLRVADQNTSIVFALSSPSVLLSGDILTVEVPSQISIQQNIECSIGSTQLTCNINSASSIIVSLTFPNGKVGSNTTFQLMITGFSNPVSGAPTDNFQMSISDQFDFGVATLLNSNLSIQMMLPYLITQGQQITHDNSISSIPTVIQISFQPAHPIPSGAFFNITSPKQLSLDTFSLAISSPTTFLLGNKKVIELSSGGYSFIVIGLVAQSFPSGVTFTIQIIGFNNSLFAAATDSFTAQYFTSEGYVIDAIQSGLTLSNKCDYPCATCTGVKNNTCTSCLDRSQSPYYALQGAMCLSQCNNGYFYYGSTDSGVCLQCNSTCSTCSMFQNNCTSCGITSQQPYYMLISGNQGTCVSTCPDGFYLNQASKSCLPCDQSCATCSGQSTACTSCLRNTFLWKGTCYQNCPGQNTLVGIPSNWTCQPCDPLCQTCNGQTSQCTSCSSNLKYFNSTCITQCPAETTVENPKGTCQDCSQKCLTCSGQYTNCTSCLSGLYLLTTASGQSGQQNSTCVSQCPSGYVLQGQHCQKCDTGCATCINGNTSNCPTCISGFNSYNFTSCLTQCPAGLAPSNDSICTNMSLKCPYGYQVNGTICSLTFLQCKPGYILDTFFKICRPSAGFWVPFPFLFLLALSSGITLISLRKRIKSGQVLTSTIVICMWSLFEPLLLVAQTVLAGIYGHYPVLALSGVCILTHYGANIWVIRRQILPRFQKDTALQYWLLTYGKNTGYEAILKWSFTHNQKLLRIYRSFITDKPCFQIALSEPITHHVRPILKGTVINAISCYVPLIVADVTCFITVPFGYQLFIICIESMVFVVLMLIVQIVEHHQVKVRLLGDTPGKYYKIQNKSVDNTLVMGGIVDAPLQSTQRMRRSTRRLLENINDELEKINVYERNVDSLYNYLAKPDEVTVNPDMPLPEKTKDGDFGNLQVHLKEIEIDKSRNKLQLLYDYDLEVVKSTQQHYEQYRTNQFIDPEEMDDPICISQRSESKYWDEEALAQGRLLFKAANDEWRRLHGTKMAMLDHGIGYHSSSQEELAMTERLQKSDLFFLGKPMYNIQDIMGQFDKDDYGNYIIVRGKDGNLIDSKGRRVNKRGYLVDSKANIINKKGQQVIKRQQLDTNDDVPTGLFQALFQPKMQALDAMKKSLKRGMSHAGIIKSWRSTSMSHMDLTETARNLDSKIRLGMQQDNGHYSAHTSGGQSGIGSRLGSEDEQLEYDPDSGVVRFWKPKSLRSVGLNAKSSIGSAGRVKSESNQVGDLNENLDGTQDANQDVPIDIQIEDRPFSTKSTRTRKSRVRSNRKRTKLIKKKSSPQKRQPVSRVTSAPSEGRRRQTSLDKSLSYKKHESVKSNKSRRSMSPKDETKEQTLDDEIMRAIKPKVPLHLVKRGKNRSNKSKPSKKSRESSQEMGLDRDNTLFSININVPIEKHPHKNRMSQINYAPGSTKSNKTNDPQFRVLSDTQSHQTTNQRPNARHEMIMERPRTTKQQAKSGSTIRQRPRYKSGKPQEIGDECPFNLIDVKRKRAPLINQYLAQTLLGNEQDVYETEKKHPNLSYYLSQRVDEPKIVYDTYIQSEASQSNFHKPLQQLKAELMTGTKPPTSTTQTFIDPASYRITTGPTALNTSGRMIVMAASSGVPVLSTTSINHPEHQIVKDLKRQFYGQQTTATPLESLNSLVQSRPPIDSKGKRAFGVKSKLNLDRLNVLKDIYEQDVRTASNFPSHSVTPHHASSVLGFNNSTLGNNQKAVKDLEEDPYKALQKIFSNGISN